MIQRIGAAAKRDFMPAYRQSGNRSLSSIKYVVWHDTEGGSAAGIASYFHGSSAEGSAHLVVDDSACYRCLPDYTIPWGAPGFNSNGVHIEQCGYAAWSTKRWLLHQVMLHRTAYKTAVFCKRYGIPVRFRGALALKEGKPGITTHAECTLSGLGGSTASHHDPGLNYPRRFVMGLTRIYRAALH